MPRRSLIALAAAAACAAALVPAGVLAAASKPVTLRDAKGDVAAAPDIQRASLSRAGDGRLRAVVTFTSAVRPADLLTGSGPPGSVCLRVWTNAKADPAAQRPDRLVCATARTSRELRGSVLQQRGSDLPRRVGSASVQNNRSGRSIILRVSQTALGRPEQILFAVEATRAGCVQPTCTDTVPAASATQRFRLR